MERPHERQEVERHVSNSHSSFKQTDPELERLKQEIAEARAKQNRELARARPVVEEDLEHEGVKCHICGWTGSVRDLKSLPNLPNQVDTEKLCPSCESNNLSSVGQQPPSQPSNPDSTYHSAYKTEYSPPSATFCCGGRCSLL